MQVAERQPWERLDGEGEAPYRSFKAFLDQPPPRSLTRLEGHVSQSYSTLLRHSSRYDWRARAAAYDRFVARGEAEAVIAEAARIRLEQLRALADARELGSKRLAELMADTGALSPRDALAMVIEAVKLERLVVGEATERVETTQDAPDLSALSDEELLALQRLQQKCRQ
jgi:hypothetical protein